jgi:hypothetical protein
MPNAKNLQQGYQLSPHNPASRLPPNQKEKISSLYSLAPDRKGSYSIKPPFLNDPSNLFDPFESGLLCQQRCLLPYQNLLLDLLFFIQLFFPDSVSSISTSNFSSSTPTVGRGVCGVAGVGGPLSLVGLTLAVGLASPIFFTGVPSPSKSHTTC